MADSHKTEHISEPIMERFSMRILSETELTNVARHLTGCPDCQAQLVSTLRRQRGVADLSFTLAPEFWLRYEHINYEQLVEFAEGKLDAPDRELIDVHLKACGACSEDVKSFLAFREQIAPELAVSYAPMEQEPTHERLHWVSWSRGRTWKPVYSGALVAIGIALVIGAALLLDRRPESQQSQQVPTPQVSPGSTPDVAANLPSPTVSHNKSPIALPNSTEALAVINDRSGKITVDKSGNVTGLDDVSAPTRNEIAQVLLSGRIDRPSILKELAGQDSILRGTNRGQPFKLISPGRTVIVSNRPTFKWESVAGARTYMVYISDSTGQITASSDQLTPDRREWIVPKSLKRGEVYAWTVTAVVDGKEIVSPGPSSPEMKFQVLSKSNLQELNKLKKTRSHLALGVFYVKIGLVAESELELREVLRLNPKSKVAINLLRSVQSASHLKH